ncbi:MAG TPA: PIN domain-containing protein [Burkholderiaceae bacterium]|nr:PIN domain-containing protein [Burkholderiaceae bacterium]
MGEFVAIDANVLVAWSDPKADKLILARLEQLYETSSKIVIPSPALAEFLVGTGEATADWLQVLERRSAVVVGNFDRRAAYEFSLIHRALRDSDGAKRASGEAEAWQRVKFDRQIVAIARVAQATKIVSNDSGLRNTAAHVGIKACTIEELPIPPEALQLHLKGVPPPDTPKTRRVPRAEGDAER